MTGLALRAPNSAKPHILRERYLDALNGAKLSDAVACFARQACLVTPDGTTVHGREAIRPLLAQMLEQATHVQVCASDLLQGGEAALLREHWRIQSSGAGEEPYVQDTQAIMVMRTIEGEWKLSILAPWGRGTPSPREAPFMSFKDQGR